MTELSWTELISRRPEYRSPPRRVRVILFFRFHKTCLPNRCPTMDYTASKSSCYSVFPLPQNVLTEPLPNNGLYERVFGDPLASNGLPLWLHYSVFEASSHDVIHQHSALKWDLLTRFSNPNVPHKTFFMFTHSTILKILCGGHAMKLLTV
jgi:hypothetical protein